MRPLTATDIIDFYDSGYDLLVLTANGEYAHLDTDAIAISSYQDNRPNAYSYATTTEDEQVQILLERSTINEGEWFPGGLTEDGTLNPDIAAEMADVINSDGILPSRVAHATEAGLIWEQAAKAADAAAVARAEAVAEIVAFCRGNQSAAARALGMDQSTVNKLVRKIAKK